VGTLDIERAIKLGERHFEPGVLAAANRGLLYVDEVNLLDDHVVDLLLDSAAMGVNVVEREGISFSHPARFILVGTMNREGGELRPLLDRPICPLCGIQALSTRTSRVEILKRRVTSEQTPTSFAPIGVRPKMRSRDASPKPRFCCPA
jgi:magnesium chelatase subunit I